MSEHCDQLTRKLPLEICSDIFALSTQDRKSTEYNQVRTTSFLLSRISKSWRHVALSTPRLWTALLCHFSNKTDFEGVNDCLPELLSRSRGCHIHLCLVEGLGFSSREVLRPVLEVFHATYPRWKELEITPLFVPILYQCSGSPLQRLSIYGSCLNPSVELRLSSTFENASPSYVHIEKYGICPSHLPIQWSSLVDFNGFGYNFQVCLHILRDAPLLKRLNVQGIIERGSISEEAPIVVHQNLETLEFAVKFTKKDTVSIYKKLSLPSLAKLTLQMGRQPAGQLDQWFGDFLSRSGCCITSLVVDHTSRSDMELNELIAHLPSLEDLEVREDDIEDIHNLFTNMIDDFTFLPNLEKLKIVHYHETCLPLLFSSQLPKLFPPASTAPSGVRHRPLKYLELDHSNYDHKIIDSVFRNPNLQEGIDELRERGIIVKMVYRHSLFS